MLNCWVCFTGEPIGMCEVMTVSGRQGMGLAGAVFPVQLPTIYSVK